MCGRKEKINDDELTMKNVLLLGTIIWMMAGLGGSLRHSREFVKGGGDNDKSFGNLRAWDDR
jgi:hypothetical protein